jgi:hypothetical protein
VPGPEQVIRTAVVLPWTITRRVVGFGLSLLPGRGDPDTVPSGDVAVEAATEALERDRDRTEPIFTPDEDFFDDDHVEQEVELVAESADAEATEPPGAQLHVDEPWEGYRRMRVDEIVGRLEGQSAEVLAAVELYETTHRHRGGVLNAVRSRTS